MRTILACLLLSLASPSAASDLIFECEEPKGRRVDYGNTFDVTGKALASTRDGIKWDEDGFSNIKPVVIWRERDKNKLLVSWGNTVPQALLGKIENDKNFNEAIVTFGDENQIQAVEVRCGSAACTTHLYSLFPKLGFMTRTDTSFNGYLRRPNEGMGVTRVFAARCKPLG